MADAGISLAGIKRIAIAGTTDQGPTGCDSLGFRLRCNT